MGSEVKRGYLLFGGQRNRCWFLYWVLELLVIKGTVTVSLHKDIRRRRVVFTSPGERNQVFETHSTHECFIYMQFIYRHYQSFILCVRAGQLEPRGRPNNSLNTRLRAALVHKYITNGGWGWVQHKAIVYKQEDMLKVRLNDKVVGLMKLDKAQSNMVLLYAALKMMSYES